MPSRVAARQSQRSYPDNPYPRKTLGCSDVFQRPAPARWGPPWCHAHWPHARPHEVDTQGIDDDMAFAPFHFLAPIDADLVTGRNRLGALVVDNAIAGCGSFLPGCDVAGSTRPALAPKHPANSSAENGRTRSATAENPAAAGAIGSRFSLHTTLHSQSPACCASAASRPHHSTQNSARSASLPCPSNHLGTPQFSFFVRELDFPLFLVFRQLLMLPILSILSIE